jgi:glycosyltransferase involved in cell wall biosynthesis
MATDLVSIVMATYNGEKFLRTQLDSIVNQTHSLVEIIITDDCSTDNTWPVIQEYKNRDSRIKAIRNEINIGYTRNFEKAIGVAQGKYIAFCDQDDIWHHEKIEILLKSVEGYGLCFSDSELIDEEGRLLGKKLSDLKNVESYTNCLPFLIGNCVPGHACLVNREALMKALPFPGFFVYDWWLAFYFSCAGKINFVKTPLVQYRQHQNNSVAAVKIQGAKRNKIGKAQRIQSIRWRMGLFYKTACERDVPEKEIIRGIHDSYQNFSLTSNLLRSLSFFRYQKQLLALKKRGIIRKWLFCIKMFFQII